MPLTPQDFVSKWKRVTGREKQIYQEHFIDLCRLAGHQTPNEYDPTGTRFGFEMGAARTSGGQGWADVAKLGYFGWEYKGFETFPFPWPPGKEPKDDRRVQAIAGAAKELVKQRDRWLKADGLNDAEKKKRTLTNLYNALPTRSSTKPSLPPMAGSPI